MANLCALFFFNDTATTEIYTLSLHDALPIYLYGGGREQAAARSRRRAHQAGDPRYAGGDDFGFGAAARPGGTQIRPRIEDRSEEHTSELQSHLNILCRLLLEKKKTPPAATAA